MKSTRFTLNKEEGKKILKGLGIAIAGAALTYLSQYLTKTDFGDLTPMVVVINSVIVNTLTKYVQGVKA